MTKSGIHVSDATIHVHGSHTGEHRVLHGATEIGFGDQGLLGLQASSGVTPSANQHPSGHATEQHHQPEKSAADQDLRSAIGLCTKLQTVANGGDRHDVFIGFGFPRGILPQTCARFDALTCQHGIVAIDQSNRVSGGDFSGNGIPEQAIDRILRHQHTTETGVVADGDMELDLGFGLTHFLSGLEDDGRRKNGLAQFFRQ